MCLQALSYKAYINFVYDLHKYCSNKPEVVKPVILVSGDEMIPDGETQDSD